MKRIFLLVVFTLATLQTACKPQTVPKRDTHTSPAASPTPTAAEPLQPCAFTWASRFLPDLTKIVQARVEAAGLTGITARAEAFGEVCYRGPDDQSDGFTAMETDFRFVVKVDGLGDKARLGATAASLLKILDALPADALAGPRPGYVGINFQSGKDQVALWFLIVDGTSALEQGLSGADLFEALLKQ